MTVTDFAKLPVWADAVDRKAAWVHRVPSRRRLGQTGRTGFDWKRTLQLWARFGTIGPQYVGRQRASQPGKLVVLWDVSGSMVDTIDLYLPWLYKLARKLPAVGVFPFGTSLVDITASLSLDFPALREELASIVDLWAGGTQIGRSMTAWIGRYGMRWLRASTTVLIISDGWERGDVTELATAMKYISSFGCRIIWMNPLASTPGFSPDTRALKAAMPYVYRLTSGHDVLSLLNFAVNIS